MPITPRILMAQGKCTEDADKYFITHITDAAVKKYNEIIRSNANEFVIHPDMVLVSESRHIPAKGSNKETAVDLFP